VLLVVLGALPLAALWRGLGPRVIVAPDFALVDGDGRTFTLSRQRGHPVVVFFGYTHCPDVCPTILARLARAVHSPTVPADERVVFVTVDPRRDTTSVLKRYMRLFDEKFVGLTGPPGTLQAVWSAYRVGRHVLPTARGSTDYSVIHGTSIYYVGRDGVMKGFGSWQDDTPELIEDLRRFV
jgi:protein SCO1/2